MTNALSIPIRSSTLSSFIGSKTPSFRPLKAACSSSSVRFPKIKACVIEPETGSDGSDSPSSTRCVFAEFVG
ncbi:hypothetical protein Tco_1132511 [Tanacetum coccineum]|uniref:Uncharacterized protein n=1 Tax=Tanacetum coccineum TaxID=301880 RepID=A0ABQ5JDV3_9ASTR